jgi:hypothetical protein
MTQPDNRVAQANREYEEWIKKQIVLQPGLTHLLRKSETGLTLTAIVDEHGHQIHRWVHSDNVSIKVWRNVCCREYTFAS